MSNSLKELFNNKTKYVRNTNTNKCYKLTGIIYSNAYVTDGIKIKHTFDANLEHWEKISVFRYLWDC